jgi:hypothetical protein
MAANQLNYEVFTYVDDNGTTWNKRGQLDTAVNGIDGSSAFTTGAPEWPRASRRFHTRTATFFDPATFRTKRIIVYTAAAYAAIDGTTTLAVSIPGETGSVTYSLSEKNAEKQPVGKTTRKLEDHA